MPAPPLRRRVGGRARFRVPGRPPGSCPRRSGCSSRRLRARVPFCGLWPPLRSALRLAPLLRPFPRSRGAPGRCGASSRPFALGSRSLRAGSPVPPCPAPFGGSRALAPPGGLLLARLAPRLFVPPSPPRGLGLVLPPLRRRRVCVFLFRLVAALWAGAALLCSCARSMLHQACACCPHSRCLAWARVSPPEKIDNAFRERDSPQEIRRAAAISAQEIFRVN